MDILSTILAQKMYTFIDRMQVVEERQVLSFFSDWGKVEAKYALKGLMDTFRVHRVGETSRITTNLKLAKNNANNYDAVIDALDVMTQLRSQDVNWYSLRDLPFELEFCVDDYSTLYTVSVFDSRNWSFRYEQTERLRSLNLPVGEPDPRKHIAVIDDERLIEKLDPLGFSMYVKIKDRNTGETVSWA